MEPRFRPRLLPGRAWRIAIGLNVLLFASLIVGPWIRGRYRAVDAQTRFARYAACLWGGAPADRPGLGLPEGEREQYATQVLTADPDWPERCRVPLAAVAPEEAMLLFPSIKNAEEQVREAVRLTDRELVAVAELRGGDPGRIPERPLLATGRLLATLSVWAQETGEHIDEESLAIEFDEPAGVVDATRVPLSAAVGAPTRVRARADGVVVTTLDGRGMSYARVGAGRVDLQRVERPGLLRSLVPGDGGPWGLWATSPRRCAEQAGGCARRSAGVGRPFSEADPEPTWLAGHPAGEPRASTVVVDDAVYMVALRTEAPHAEVRRFPFGVVEGVAPGAAPDVEPPESSESSEEPSPPVAPEAQYPLADSTANDATLLVPGEPPLVVWTATVDGVPHLRSLRLAEGVEPSDHGTLPPPRSEDTLTLHACDAPRARWVLATSGAGARILEEREDLTRSHPLVVRGAVRSVACDREVADIIGVDEDGLLSWTRCRRRRGCAEPRNLARAVAHADAARDAGVTLVAWSGDARRALVRVTRLPEEDGASPSAPPNVPAACWDPDAGLCGPPMLSARNGRVLLAGREGVDLRVVESTDGGDSWRPMTGVR